MAKKNLITLNNQDRCVQCEHLRILHGNGSQAHGLSRDCVILGCDCKHFELDDSYRAPRSRVPKTLDRTEQRLFDSSAIGL